MLSYLFWLSRQEAYFLKPFGRHFLHDSFREPEVENSWIQMKTQEFDGKWLVSAPPKPQAYDEEVMLYTDNDKKMYCITKKFEKPIRIKANKSLLIQYELRHSSSFDSKGPLLRLYPFLGPFDPKNISSNDLPLLEFGPTKEGNDHILLFNFLHKDNSTGFAELKKYSCKFNGKNDKANHLYTLIINPNNTFTFLYDNEYQLTDSFFSKAWKPMVNVPMEIDDPNSTSPNTIEFLEFIPDPNAKKPSDYDDRKKIPNPNATKPDNWFENEPEMIPDPNQIREDTWDEDFDGKWVPNMIPNPKCQPPNKCGIWTPPLIDNPNYKGEWIPPNISNPKYKGPFIPKKIIDPNFVPDEEPYRLLPAIAAGFMVNTTTKKVCVNNIIITADVEDILQWNRDFFLVVQKNQYKAFDDLDNYNKYSSGYYHPRGTPRKSITLFDYLVLKPINIILQKYEPDFDLILYKEEHSKEVMAYLLSIAIIIWSIIGGIFYKYANPKKRYQRKKKIPFMVKKANLIIKEKTRTSKDIY